MGLQVPCIDPLSETHGHPCQRPLAADHPAEIDMSHIEPSEPVVSKPETREVPELPVRQVRETVEIIGFETHVPTKAEIQIATTTAVVTSTAAVVATSVVQQLIKVMSPVIKAGLKRILKRKNTQDRKSD